MQGRGNGGMLGTMLYESGARWGVPANGPHMGTCGQGKTGISEATPYVGGATH